MQQVQQASKKSKVTKEATITEIATSILDISETLNEIGQTHKNLLKSNEVIVKYLLAVQKGKKQLNYSDIGNSSQAPTQDQNSAAIES